MILESLTMWWLLQPTHPARYTSWPETFTRLYYSYHYTVGFGYSYWQWRALCFGFCSCRNQFGKHTMYYTTWIRRIVCIRSSEFYSARGDCFANGYYVVDPCHKITPSGTASSANLGFATKLYDTQQVQSYSTKHFISVWERLYTDIIFSSHCWNS